MPNRETSGRIVVGVDGSPASQAALTWAAGQAHRTGAVLVAVTAWQYPVVYGYPLPMAPLSTAAGIARRVSQEAVDALRAQPDLPDVVITPVIAEGNPAAVLLHEAEHADLLVVGSRGHGGFAEALLGSTGQHCVHHAVCPVVVIRAPARSVTIGT